MASKQVSTLGTPACSDVEPTEVIRWFERAQSAMKRRNSLFHAVHYSRVMGGGLVPTTEHIRERFVREAGVDVAAAVREELEELQRAGVELSSRLLHGTSHNHFVQWVSEGRSAESARRYELARQNYPACPAEWLYSPDPMAKYAELEAEGAN